MPADANPEKDRVYIFDTTLRDGEQSPGISLDTEEKLMIGHQLARLGVDVIEAGFPITSEGDFEAVQAIAREVEGPTICALARTHKADIDAAAKAIKDAEHQRIHTFISTSDIHIEHQLQTDREDVKGQARAAVALAKTYTDDVEFSPMDATRADPEFTAEVCAIAVEEGATVLNIPDTVGYTTPEEYAEYFGMLAREIPELRTGAVRGSVHCHDDLGMAMANSYAGLLAGARQVECAVNGIGERAGNLALEEMVMLVEVRQDEHGFYTLINTEELGPTSRLVAELTDYPVARNKAVIGRNAFAHESGIHQDGILKERSTYEIMAAEDVGAIIEDEDITATQGIVLGKHSGKHAIRTAIESVTDYDAAHTNTTFKLFKGFADKMGTVTTQQTVEIHREAIRRDTADYTLVDYPIEAREGFAEAEVQLKDKTGREHKGQATSKNSKHDDVVDGAVSAIFSALDEATDTNFGFVGYKSKSIGQGNKGTMDRATVKLQYNGSTIEGYGVSTDVLKAAALAYLNAIQKAEEAKAERERR
ncbi:MAG TPA: 2-isopropylmalate synthase [Candidatus Saccharimonadales bacterium]|nr:2-isopropylmalate synthase [Candidatus Saccharimonadales bacterium]